MLSVMILVVCIADWLKCAYSAISRWMRAASACSRSRSGAELAKKFESCDAFGFQPGARSKITILDVDTTNERVLADAEIRHGESPLKVRTASGKFHVYYRHNGEPRKNSAMARTADRSAWAQRVCGGSAIAGGERAISGYRGVT